MYVRIHKLEECMGWGLFDEGMWSILNCTMICDWKTDIIHTLQEKNNRNKIKRTYTNSPILLSEVQHLVSSSILCRKLMLLFFSNLLRTLMNVTLIYFPLSKIRNMLDYSGYIEIKKKDS